MKWREPSDSSSNKNSSNRTAHIMLNEWFGVSIHIVDIISNVSLIKWSIYPYAIQVF